MARTARPITGARVFAKPTGEAKPSIIYMEDTAGEQWALWFDTSGNLRTSDPATVEAGGFNFNSGGTVVGAQT